LRFSFFKDGRVVGQDKALGKSREPVGLAAEYHTVHHALGVDARVEFVLLDQVIDGQDIAGVDILLHPLAVHPHHVVISRAHRRLERGELLLLEAAVIDVVDADSRARIALDDLLLEIRVRAGPARNQ
jgi:hypothetical protein